MRIIIILIFGANYLFAGLGSLVGKGATTLPIVASTQSDSISRGGMEIILILGGILLLFNWKRNIKLINGLIAGLKNFKKSVADDEQQK